MDSGPKYKRQNYKTSEKTQEKSNLGQAKISYRTQTSQTVKENVDTLDFIKIKIFCSSKDK